MLEPENIVTDLVLTFMGAVVARDVARSTPG